MCTHIPTYHTSEKCPRWLRIPAFRLRPWEVHLRWYWYSFRFRRINFKPHTARSIPYLIDLICILSLSGCKDWQINGVFKFIQIFHATGRNSPLYVPAWSFVGYLYEVVDENQEKHRKEHTSLSYLCLHLEEVRNTFQNNNATLEWLIDQLIGETIFWGRP